MTEDRSLPRPAAGIATSATPRGRELQLGLSVAMAAVIAYAAALAGQFVYDDLHSVSGNPGIQTLANLPRFFVDPSLFSASGAEMYRPLLLCSFALDWAVGGGAALAFKLSSVLVHAVASWLLFGLCRAYGLSLVAAAAAGLWFAVHPLASETVNMISSRSEGLLVVGMLLALLGHRRWLQGARWGGVATLAGAALACGSKETGVVVPALLLLQEWLHRPAGAPRWPSGAELSAVARRVLPAVALVVIYLVVRKILLGQATVALVGRQGTDPMYGGTRDLLTQLSTMGAALPGVLLQVVWPTGLTLDPHVDYYRSPFALPVLCGWLSLIALVVSCWHLGRSRPAVRLGLGIAVLTALPWVVVPLNVPVAEHRMYGVLAGIAVLIGTALDSAALRRVWGASAGAGRRRAAAVLGGAALLVLATLAALRSAEYRHEELLWRSALQRDPTSFRAHWGLGLVLARRGDQRAAERALAHAVALYPRFRGARRAWIESMLHLPMAEGWPHRAVVAAEELTRQKDDDPYYRLLHANALLQAGMQSGEQDRIRAAEARVLSCLEIAEPKALVFRLAAECRVQLDDLAGALAHFDDAVARGLDLPSLRAERSEVLRAMGRTSQADQELERAFREAPTDGTVRQIWSRRFAAGPR